MDALDLWRGRSTHRSLLNDMLEMMNEFERPLRSSLALSRGGAEGTYFPASDIRETEENFLLSIDMPGINKEDIDIELNGNQLMISGERKKEEELSENGAHRIERAFGHFKRTFTLPEGINSEVIEASYDNGVLSICLPKAEEKKAKKITIGSSSKSFLKGLTKKVEAKAINS